MKIGLMRNQIDKVRFDTPLEDFIDAIHRAPTLHTNFIPDRRGTIDDDN